MGGDRIDVSVIITVYNIEKYIGECLDSVLAEKVKRIEVICVDDASTDHSSVILKEYAKKDERVRVLENRENMGAATSRNIGCRAARGKFLHMIDGDDLLEEGAEQRLYDCACENRLDILTFNATPFWESGVERRSEKAYTRRGTYRGIYTGPELFAEFMKNRDTRGNLCLNFINRSFFLKNNLYRPEGVRYAGDDEPFEIYMRAQRVMCIPDILYRRRFRPGSLVTSPPRADYLEGQIVQFLHEMDVWESCRPDEKTDRWIERYMTEMQAVIKKTYRRVKEEEDGKEPRLSGRRARYFYKYFLKGVPLYEERLNREDLERIRRAGKVIVYGAGQYGHEIAEVLEYHGITGYEAAVTQTGGQEKLFHGKVIQGILDLKPYAKTALVIVAAGPSNQDPMIELLEKEGFEQYCVMH